ncbi:hypothetical protein F5B22DRAFT_588557 [Xylaria bambusicola]|uniref:uncharacterized protein n=1 Tax=Xylaria bambusicola TaxID=326684 RepID=UPI00200805EC|nr:uncharacterized protein F5B22DRAFT_588557 [Xylaria bambusicola]KAI0525983.1 hypothetical protein F5B22DRAFT_588557 [Xylaria bambusicola]
MPGHKWKSGLPQVCQKWLGEVAANLRKKSVWQPMLKNIISTIIVIIIGVIPAVVNVYGKSTFLGAIASVFGQPGQRFGKMVEIISLIVLGTFLGLGWGNLGLYLSSLAHDSNIHAAWTIRAVFFVLAVIFHGVLRSAAPRLFQLVFFFMLINLGPLTSSGWSVTLSQFEAVVYPILTAIGVVILVNIAIFPQFSSGFLGTSTIEALTETIILFQEAGDWFMCNDGDGGKETSPKTMRSGLAALSNKKPKLRARLRSCKAVQAECNFELGLTVLPPQSLKPISVIMMTRLVQITTSLINACESKYALVACDNMEDKTIASGDEKANTSQIESDTSSDEELAEYQRNIDLIKPVREIESGDINILEQIMLKIWHPAKSMQDQIRDAVHLITSTLAYCYDVPQLPSRSPKPDGILLQEMDIRIDILSRALAQFDSDSVTALESAAVVRDGENSIDDMTPRLETHLVSSFVICLSQAAREILEMLKYARNLVEKRQARNGRRKLYWPKISWKKWLISGGEQDGNVLPESARREARSGYGSVEDEENADGKSDCNATAAERISVTGHLTESGPVPNQNKKGSRQKRSCKSYSSHILWIRGLAADVFEFLQNSDHFIFALKMAIAALLVTWPAFVPSLNAWYVSVRGTWATFQLILVFEVSIGTTFLGFLLRAFGTTLGCSIGIIAWEAGQGNLVVLVVILAIGLIPASYVQLATPYVKAGIICMISLSVVGLTIANPANNDAPWQIYVKRLACFLAGGTVALVIEMTIFPVRARDRLVELLVSSISQISVMESTVATEVDSPNFLKMEPQSFDEQFHNAKKKAEQALDAARAFLPFCLTEPRIKGNFEGYALVYREMIHVLFQIIERMDNILHTRKLFGRSVLEELREEILPYRRNVAGCVSLTLFVVQEALTTRLPIPQYLPSSRVAQLRSVARIRELLLTHKHTEGHINAEIPTTSQRGSSIAIDNAASRSVTRFDFLAWKASSAGMMEVIEYLEELVDLAKLLVGVNAFRGGLLEHPDFHAYQDKMSTLESEADATSVNIIRRRRLESIGAQSSIAQRMPSHTSLRRRQTAGATPTEFDHTNFENDDDTEENDISWSLQRVVTKRMEEARSKRRGAEDPKGKYALRSVHTWTG